MHASARRSTSLSILAVRNRHESLDLFGRLRPGKRAFVDAQLLSCVLRARLTVGPPPTPLPLSPYNRTFPSTLPPNAIVFLWSLRAPLLCWARPSGRLLSSSLVPVLFLPPPLPIPWSSLLGLVVPLGLVAVCWWVHDNPAPWARARAQVAAFATRGTG